MRQLAMRFRGVPRGHSVEALRKWLKDAHESGIYAMRRFARMLQSDQDAVRNALTLSVRVSCAHGDLHAGNVLPPSLRSVGWPVRGRKYGLGLMLVSQRPADIESTVPPQCGTWLILRLSNNPDQQHVSRFLPDGLAGMTRALASLGQQEALFVGEGASLLARVRIRDLADDRPRSEPRVR